MSTINIELNLPETKVVKIEKDRFGDILNNGSNHKRSCYLSDLQEEN